MNYFRQKRNPFQLINGTPASFANFCKWGEGGGGGGLLRILSDVKTQDVFGSCGVKFWVQGFWGFLLEALGFCLSFNVCPHLIMAVTCKCNVLEGLLRT